LAKFSSDKKKASRTGSVNWAVVVSVLTVAVGETVGEAVGDDVEVRFELAVSLTHPVRERARRNSDARYFFFMFLVLRSSESDLVKATQ
jgi:hypothetical protein